MGRGQAKLESMGLDAVCDWIGSGKTMTSLAEYVGVSFWTLNNWINADSKRSARVTEARIVAATAWDEMALDAVLQARGKFDLLKAREAAHHYRWRASKISPQYADRKPPPDEGGADATIRIIGGLPGLPEVT
jgi:hypothetical protein